MLLQFLIEGGLLFTAPICFIGLLLIFFFIQSLVSILKQQSIHKRLLYMHKLGLLALFLGVLGQLIGLTASLRIIESAHGKISRTIIYKGLFISFIPTFLGLIIFILSKVTRLYLKWFQKYRIQ